MGLKRCRRLLNPGVLHVHTVQYQRCTGTGRSCISCWFNRNRFDLEREYICQSDDCQNQEYQAYNPDGCIRNESRPIHCQLQHQSKHPLLRVQYMGLKEIVAKLTFVTAMASIHDTIYFVWHRFIDVLFSYHVTRPGLL